MNKPDISRNCGPLSGSQIEKGREFTVAQLCTPSSISGGIASLKVGDTIKIIDVDARDSQEGYVSIRINGKWETTIPFEEVDYLIVEQTED